ncbi:MAG: hypothetical protein WC292_02585 [Clostridia bacterium]
MNTDKKSDINDVPPSNTEEKDKNPLTRLFARISKLSKKAKVVILCCIAVVLLGVGAALAIILIPQDNPPLPQTKILYVSEYQYGVVGGDGEGVSLNSSWMQGLSYSAFRVTIVSDLVALSVSEEMRLVADATEDWATAEIIFYYKNNKITTYKVDIIPAANAVNITSEQGLKSIPSDSKQRYILKNDILLTSPVSIKNFGGAFYGNYFDIKNLDVSASGGLFDTTSNAYVTGLRLTNVRGGTTLSENNYFGVIANRTTLSRFINCYAEGAAEVTTGLQGYYYIGGLFGQISGHSRKENTDNPLRSLFEGCNSQITLTINGGGELYVGGIAGGVMDASFANSESAGDIHLEAQNFIFIYLGGIAGVMEKRYSTPLRITYFDSSYGLRSAGNIVVNSKNTTLLDTIYVGGIFGYIKNANTSSVIADGNISITTLGASVIAGGFAGKCENELAKEGIELRVLNTEIQGELNIDTSGNIYAGGLIGIAKGNKKIKTEKTIGAKEPNIINPNILNTVETGANIGHTEE